MKENDLEQYTPEIGLKALPFLQATHTYRGGVRQCQTVINQLNDYLSGKSFEIPRGKRRREPIEAYPEIEEYLEWCAVKGLAQGTLNNYRDLATRISNGFSLLGLESIDSLTMRTVVGFCETLSKYTLSEKHNTVFVLNNLLHFLYERGYTAIDFSGSVLNVRYDHKSKLPSVYTQDEISALLKAIGTETPLAKRNYATALLAARTGMRRSDIARLRFDSIDWENDKIEIAQKKTGASLCLQLIPEVGEAIADYILNGRPVSDSDCVFLTHIPPYEPMKPGTLNDAIIRALEKAGIDTSQRKQGPHALRHSLASEMLSRGETIKTIADTLGHQSIQTATIYAKIDIPSLGKCALSVPEYREVSNFVIDERLELPVVGDLAPHIVDFILYKRAMGQKGGNELKHLRNLGKFSLPYDLSESLLPQEMVEKWLIRRKDEKANSQAGRCSVLQQFATFLQSLGYPVYIPDIVKRNLRSRFSPHIFSDDELNRFFSVADSWVIGKTSVISERKLLIPTLFRILLGCGLRIAETLRLKGADVDIERGTLRVLGAKNNKDRLVVMDTSLSRAIKAYIDTNIDAISPCGYILSKNGGGLISDEAAYDWFRKILDRAGIPHNGKDHGPRVHDFRHTFAVRSLNKMIAEGKPLYAALPILKEYLGHSDIAAIERYVRLVEWMYPEVIRSMNSISETVIPSMEALV